MSGHPPASDDDAHRRFIADPEVLAALAVNVEDLGDRDVRATVIRHEHPEFDRAFEERLDQVDLGYGPINPRLHLAMHEIVATQLWDDDPPEVWQTATRLLEAGYDRHEILHMLMRTTSDQVWAAWHDHQPYDRDRHIADLHALPGPWEQERATLAAERRHDDARKTARRRARAARRRNRRPK
jgi:Domain of unknown function (DUF1841)